MPHSRGFGIQSPSDYWLVRYVINEHWPYYQYATLGTGDDWETRKLGRLYFRMANWLQPAVIVTDAYQPYFQAACHKAKIIDSIGNIPHGAPAALIRLTVEQFAAQEQSILVPRTSQLAPRKTIIIEGIHRNKAVWQRGKNFPLCTVSFDLYYCGILIFDPKRKKQDYIVNF